MFFFPFFSVWELHRLLYPPLSHFSQGFLSSQEKELKCTLAILRQQFYGFEERVPHAQITVLGTNMAESLDKNVPINATTGQARNFTLDVFAAPDL